MVQSRVYLHAGSASEAGTKRKRASECVWEAASCRTFPRAVWPLASEAVFWGSRALGRAWDLSGGGVVLGLPRGVRQLHVCEQRHWERPPACGHPLMTLCSRVFQGKVHLELRLSEVITDTGAVCHKLAVR